MIAAPARIVPAARAAAPSRATAAALGSLLAREPTAGDAAVDAERNAFDLVLKLQAEHEREMNALRDLAMEQVKRDDETLKKWIALI